MYRLMFDFNNIFMRYLFMKEMNAKNNPNMDFLAYLIFEFIENKIRIEDPDEVIIALDNPGGYWRKEIYPEYKSNRKKDLEIDWEYVYGFINEFVRNLQAKTRWKVLQIEGCEADDIIAVLSRYDDSRNVIYSGDIDYVQLVSPNTKVYNLTYDTFIEFPTDLKMGGNLTRIEDPEDFINLCVLMGQSKDNIGNVRTPTGHQGRKPPFGIKKAIKAIDEEGIDKYAEDENFLRNKKLIDLREIPAEIQDRIKDIYENYEPGEPDIVGILDEYRWPSIRERAPAVQEILEKTSPTPP